MLVGFFLLSCHFMQNSNIFTYVKDADKRCSVCYNRFLGAEWLPLSLLILCHCNYKLERERTALALKKWEQGLSFIGTWKKMQLPPQPSVPPIVTWQPDAPLQIFLLLCLKTMQLWQAYQSPTCCILLLTASAHSGILFAYKYSCHLYPCESSSPGSTQGSTALCSPKHPSEE